MTGVARVLINRRSRQGQQDLGEVFAAIQQAGFVVEQHFPEHPEALRAAIRAPGHCDLVVIGGGDGTLNTALPALLDLRQPILLLPLGTGNDLARTLGVPLEPMAAVRLLRNWQPLAVDVAQVNGHYFLNVANIGLGTLISQQATPSLKRRTGILSYLAVALRTVWRRHSFRVSLTCDDRTEQFAAIHLGIGNGRYYGAGMVIAADATIIDHRLVVSHMPPQHLGRLLRGFLAFRRGRPSVSAELLRCREVTVTTRPALDIDTDGEITTSTPAHFTILPGALTFLTAAATEATP